MIGQRSLFAPDITLPLRRRVEVRIITTAQARYTLENLHYLHRCRTGRQINYAVLIDGVVDGVITYAYPMMSASIEDVPSDELVEFARLYLHSNIPHTATCAIGKTLKRIVQDWATLYPESKPIKLAVSWSDTEYHKGTIYKAANFKWLKRTRGQPPGNKEGSKRGSRVAHGDYKHDKDCWIYWLDRKGRGGCR